MPKPHVTNTLRLAVLACISICSIPSARAQPEITQDGFYIYDQINYFSPIGQVFTPTVNSPVAVWLDYADFNPSKGGNSLTVAIYKGAGNSGPLVESTTITLANGFTGMYPAYFPSTTLLAGTVYTVVPIDFTARWGVGTDNVNPYSAGELLYQGGLYSNGALTFEVDAVPEPATTALIVIEMAALGLALRRKTARA